MSKPNSADLRGLLKKLFSQTDADSEAAQVQTTGPTPPPAPKHKEKDPQLVEDRQDFESRLQDFLSQKGTAGSFTSGRVHLINVDEVRTKLGQKWENMSDRVHRIIKNTLKSRLSSQDFFTPQGDDTYIIIFGNSPEEEAKLKCALLAEEIMEKIFGEDQAKEIELLGVRAIVTRVDGSIATEDITSTDALAGLLQKADESRSASSTAEDPATPYWNRALSADEITGLLGTAEAKIQACEDRKDPQGEPDGGVEGLQELLRQLRNFEKALAAEDTKWSKAGAENSRAQPTIEWENQPVKAQDILHQLISRTEIQLAHRQSQLSGEHEANEHMEPPLTVAISFLPMWHVTKQAVGLHLCQLSLEYGAEHLTYTSILKKGAPAEIVNTIDKILVRKIKQELQESCLAGVINIVGVPIHYSTLEGIGSRRDFQYMCHTIPEDFRNRLVWEIVKAPLESWRSRLPEAIAAARPFGRAVFLRVDLFRISFSDMMHNLKHLRPAGVQAVGFDVTTVPASQSGVIEMLEQLAAGAKEHGLKCYAHGLGSMSLVTAAVCAGLDHVSGEVVAEETDAIHDISPTTAEAIYLRSFGLAGQ